MPRGKCSLGGHAPGWAAGSPSQQCAGSALLAAHPPGHSTPPAALLHRCTAASPAALPAASPAMHALAARRAFGSLASKIHPQLPLTPRESQQLLNLLTTSFRSHLDREHPTAPSDRLLPTTSTELACVEQPRRLPSSYDSAADHIGSILANPLFARRPQRRASDASAAVAADVLKDPLAWFLDHVALGTADVAKASLCIHMLRKTQSKPNARRRSLSQSNPGARPASIIAEWLRTSGAEASKDFMAIPMTANGLPKESLVHTLVPMLLAEGNQTPLWRWYSCECTQNDTLTAAQVAEFKAQLLKQMVASTRTRDEALAVFLQACRQVGADKSPVTGPWLKSLQVVGSHLVNQIVANTQVPCTPALYEEFALSTQSWLLTWKPVVQAMLCLCHPTQPDPQPALGLIRHPDSIIGPTMLKQSRQKFMVRMCLAAAQQLIKEEKFSDAQLAMEFTKEHFSDMVLMKYRPANQKASVQKKMAEEKKNVALLDRLLLT